jgi:hypothetical protein
MLKRLGFHLRADVLTNLGRWPQERGRVPCGSRRGPSLAVAVAAAVLTLAAPSAVSADTFDLLSPTGSSDPGVAKQRSNHCIDLDGSDLNDVYNTNDAFVLPWCTDVLAGSRWRPLVRWTTATTYEVAPPDYEPLGATPQLDFLAKLESTRYVIDADTAGERSIEVDVDQLLIDTSRSFGDSFDVTSFTPRLPPLLLGVHTVDVYLTMSAEHWDGLGLDGGNHLPAGETFVHSAVVNVFKLEPEPQGPPRPASPDLRVELVWDTEADLDLHLLHPNGDWNTSPWDCYWANRSPDWGHLGAQRDDPLLEVDDIDGFGPEVITLSSLERVTYQVGVLYFFDEEDRPTTATVRVWAGEELVREMTTDFPGPRHFWTVAAITLEGRDIKVTPIDEVRPL